MERRVRIDAQKEGAKAKWNKGMRVICAILCITLLMGAFVGCTSLASYEDVVALQGDLDKALGEIDATNDKYADALKEMDLLKTSRDQAQKNLEELKTEHEATEGALALLGNNHKSAEEKINELNKTIEAAKQELALLKENGQAAQQKIESLQAALDAAQNTVNTLQGQQDVMQNAMSNLQGQQDAMQNAMSTLQGQYDEAQAEIRDLTGQLEELKNQLLPDAPQKKIKIYIDQGHNPTSYHNSGASGNGLHEEDLTFTIGVLLAELLRDDGRFEVRLSRPTATTVLGTDNSSSLDARVKGAQDFGADYFISLHVNAFTTSSATGIEAYTVESSGESYDFGNSLLQGMAASTNLRNRGMKTSSSLRVLNKATMPATLLEMGFISNPDDAKLLAEHPEVFATGIYNGILNYFLLEPIEPSAN